MKAFLVITFLSLSFGFAYADTLVPKVTNFGAKDTRGAYQEVHIKSAIVSLDYFSIWDQEDLQQDAQNQSKYDIWPDSNADAKSWGRNMELAFQDGELKTQNTKSRIYEQLDTSRTYAVVYAKVAFDNKEQAQSGIYSVDGVVTLVTGQFSYGPINVGSNKSNPAFKQSAVMGYIMSGAYYHDCNPGCITGGQFNQFGNGKNDGGRIHSVGLISTAPTPLSIGELKQALGSLVQVVYP